MVTSPVVQCYCLPENPDNLEQHVVGHCPAVESDDVVAQGGLQQVTGSHLCTLPLSYSHQQRSTEISPHGQSLPRP